MKTVIDSPSLFFGFFFTNGKTSTVIIMNFVIDVSLEEKDVS